MDPLLDRLHPRWFRDVARMTLERPTFDWVDSGATGSADVAAFTRVGLLPRVLVDVSDVDTSTSIAGTRIALPVLASPMGLQRALHPEGEVALARGAAEAAGATVVSANTSVAIDEIASAVPDGTLWLQLANWTDRDSTAALVARAEEAGVRAIVPLVNGPVAAAHVDPSVGFRLPEGVSPAHPAASPGIDATLTPDYLEWLVGRTSLPVIPKGIMHPSDARRAADAGASGVIVSNHGGRQLPRAIGTLSALPAVVDGVPDGVEVYLDGGVRTGADVLIALAYGATAVMLGRPLAWALAVGGAAGVAKALGVVGHELREASALSGIRSTRDASRDLLVTTHSPTEDPT